MTRPRLIIAPGKEKALQRRHPWLFSGAVSRVEGKPQEGDVVDVVDARGHWLAVGHYQPETIICKVLSFATAQVDADFYRGRIRSAIAYRRQLGFATKGGAESRQGSNVFRMVHAEGDGLPGLVADWYNGVLVLQAHSAGMHRALPLLADLFRQELGADLVSIFDKSLVDDDGAQNSDANCYIYGIEPAEWEINEGGNRLMINFREGQKTGFFIDQRENRQLVCDLARGHRVLNCFGYTGGFSLSALRGGAEWVETVDISKKAIALANRNVELNFGIEASHRGVVADVLEYLNPAAQSGVGQGRFDFIILDPPAFAKNHRALQQGLKGYRAINQRAMQLLPAGGLLMTFSCSQAVSTDDFRTMVFSSAAMAGREVRIVRSLPHAADHPVSIYHPEGEYLKGLLLEVE